MRNTNPWAALFLAVPILLVTASSSFAAPKKDQTPPQTQIEATKQALDDGSGNEMVQDVSVVLTLDDGAARSAVTPKAYKPAKTKTSAIEGALCKIRDVATRCLGTPYRWGGTTPKAFDCSGFTRYVYSALGVRIPRTAREQFKVGKPVQRQELQTGDLLFFNMAKGYVSHVGLYLGDGVFIHASNPRSGVKYSNLNDKSYRRTYVGARRYQSA